MESAALPREAALKLLEEDFCDLYDEYLTEYGESELKSSRHDGGRSLETPRTIHRWKIVELDTIFPQ